VSVVICAYNSARLLPATLEHLQSQDVPSDIPWEVIVIDNGSKDGTDKIARRCWPGNYPTTLRVIHEQSLGLSCARRRAFSEACFELVSFVDDDNWVCPDWVASISKVLSERPEVGGCGGVVRPVFEVPPPEWCLKHSLCKPWPPSDRRGDVTETLGYLMGAGLTVRVSAYREIVGNGFRQIAIDRQGGALTSGGDHELCFALRLAGWRLWVEPTIWLNHFLPARRLTWQYWLALVRGVGFSSVALDPYLFALEKRKTRAPWNLSHRWLWQTAIVAKHLGQNMLIRPYKVLRRRSASLEGDEDALRIEGYIGRLQGLLQSRSSYEALVRRVAQDYRI
jgi:glycosyltransferase involved in cell wall biosynthesis